MPDIRDLNTLSSELQFMKILRDLAKSKRETEQYVLNHRDITDYYEEMIYQAYDNYVDYWIIEKEKNKNKN